MSTSHSILHYTRIKINTKIYANNIQDNHQDLYQDRIKIYSKITITIEFITYSMNSNIYTNTEAHILRSKMNSIHERHVSSQEKPRRMNHKFMKITRWINNRKTEINYRSCHHIALVTIFPMSQEFCNSDSVWESYANFSESLWSKYFSSTKFHTFLWELRNTKERLGLWINEMFDLVFIHKISIFNSMPTCK